MLTLDEMLAIFNADVAKWEAEKRGETVRDPRLPVPVDWHALFARKRNEEWLVDDIWPAGRQVHMHAARKTGKSLISLFIACNLACGRDPFTGVVVRPVIVGYLDYEMTEDDLLERVEEMGFDASALDERLFYYLHPAIPKLDTAAGGERLMETLALDKVEALVIDTMSRVVAGEENSNDTYIHFYEHTGQALKAAGIAMMRLDHEGHENGRSRGASAKADDVDVVWQLRTTDDGLEFVRKASRISWVGERVPLHKHEDPLRFDRVIMSWPAGTVAKAKELDDAGVPIDASRRSAAWMLKSCGYEQGRPAVIQAALKYRQNAIPNV